MQIRFQKRHSNCQGATKFCQPECSHHSGIITFWVIVSIPIFLIALCIVLDVGNLWAARIQLKNSLESAALSAVKTWGDANGGDTLIPRQVGNQFSSANVINGEIVDLSVIDPILNYNVLLGPNQNDTCAGSLIFGALIEDDPWFVFDSCVQPGCGPPFDVVMDATAQGNLGGQNGGDNEWGISIQPRDGMDTDITVLRVTYHLPATYNAPNGAIINPVFDFTGFAPNVSPNLSDFANGNKMVCSPGQVDCDPNTGGIQGGGGTGQADVFGVVPSEVEFLINVPFGDDGSGGRLECSGMGTVVTGQTNPAWQSKTLTVEFCNDPGCEPFDLGDRIRFGAFVRDTGTGQLDADDIGIMEVDVSICLSDGSVMLGQFYDNHERNLGPDCRCADATFPAWGNCTAPGRQGMTIHPNGSPDLPCPDSGLNNNGQALVELDDQFGSGRPFAVRAQATYEVRSICSQICGVPVGPFTVSARADAFYDCQTRRPRLYHIEDEHFVCTAPCP